MLLNGVRARLEASVEAHGEKLRRTELDRRLREEIVDVTLPGEQLPVGHLHPITQVRRIVEDSFLGLGYEIRDDREVETVEYNFDKLAFEVEIGRAHLNSSHPSTSYAVFCLKKKLHK